MTSFALFVVGLPRMMCRVSRRFLVRSRNLRKAELPNRIHEALIREGYEGELVGHISRDSTAIEDREKPVFEE